MFSTRSGWWTLSKNIRLAYDDEGLARMASAADSSSSCPNTCFFSSSRSGTGSMTSHPACTVSLRSALTETWPGTAQVNRSANTGGEHQRDTAAECSGADHGHRPAYKVGWHIETHCVLLILRGYRGVGDAGEVA